MSAGFCDEHVGDAHRPRCRACEVLEAEYGVFNMRRCPTHPAHFRPCTKGCEN